MWFKNLLVYRFTKPFMLTDLALEEKLAEHTFQACNNQQTSSFGWVSPLGKHGEQLVHSTNGFLMICAKEQEKLLPAAVINEKLEEKVQEIQEKEAREVYRKEKGVLKEELIFDLLPRAFTRSRLLYAFIAPAQGLLFINSSSANKAENLLNQLRESIGSLAVIPLTCKGIPAQSMTQWLKSSSAPEAFAFGQDCVLKEPQQESTLRCKQFDLQSDEFIAHLNAGFYVSQLQLNWRDKILFSIDENLSIKQLKFTDLAQQEDEQYDDAATQFDADFSIMSAEIIDFIGELVSAFGGETEF